MEEDLITFTPDNPLPRHLKNELNARGLTQSKAAEEMFISKQLLSNILCDRKDLSLEVALKIEAYLGIRAELLLTLQTRHKMRKIKPILRDELAMILPAA